MSGFLLGVVLKWLTACVHVPFAGVVCLPMPAGVAPLSAIALAPGPTWVLVEVLP